jgi:hypothetical protein
MAKSPVQIDFKLLKNEPAARKNKTMNSNARQTIRFLLGVGCVVSALAGAFCDLPWHYFVVIFAGGCGLMGRPSILEKVAALLRGRS